MASRIKNFSIMGVHWKIEFLRGGRGGGHEKPMYRKEFPKKVWGAWTVRTFKRVLSEKVEGGVFKGGS